jgi:plastocyanin
MTTPRMILVSAAIALVAMAACGPDGDEPATAVDPDNAATSSASDGATVDVVNIAFKPAELRILRSTEVTWVNGDAGVAHTVTSGTGGSNAVAGVSDGTPSRPDGTFDGDLPADGSFSFTFNEAGTFEYFCEIYPSMRATVVVD